MAETAEGKNKLFNDSRLGLTVTGLLTVAFDAVLTSMIETLSNVSTAGWNGWWVTAASALLATGLGALTAYKAKRDKRRAGVV